MSLEPGVRIGSYEILTPLGAGGMGQVYRARDPRLGREVAVKVLRPESVADRERLRRFLSEARTVAALNHPNVLTLHDFGESESGPYLVTELVHGQTLRELVSKGPLDVDSALDFAVQIAEGLAKAHEAGIVHRDVKPENVMVTQDGYAKILDFGLAKLPEGSIPGLSADQTLTADGMIIGTPAYLAPEQLQGHPADPRSDVFALGLVLYELISGSNPFWRPSAIGTMNAILTEEPAPLTRADVPSELSDILRRATAKEANGRYSDAREMATALKSLRLARATSLEQRSRWRYAGWIGGAVIAALVAFLFWDIVRTGSSVDSKRQGIDVPRPEGEAPVRSLTTVPEGSLGVAVVPIVDESGDDQLKQAGIGRILADAFVQVLVDIPGLYVIDRHRLESVAMSLGRSIDDAAGDQEFAREVGTRSEAGAVLSGTLSRLGGTYILSATLTQIPSDVVLSSFRGQADSLEALLSELTGPVSEELRRKYGAAAAGGLENVATASLEAYTHYVRGDDLIHEGNWDDAIPELREAVRIDPEMALAWSALSCAFSFAEDETSARAAHLQAVRFADRLNERQRRWLELDGIWVTTLNGDLYLEAMERYQQDYPDDHRSELYAGLAWQWLKKNCSKALEHYERAYTTMSHWYPITKARVDCLLELGRKAEAEQVLRDYLALRSAPAHGRTKASWRLKELGRGS